MPIKRLWRSPSSINPAHALGVATTGVPQAQVPEVPQVPGVPVPEVPVDGKVEPAAQSPASVAESIVLRGEFNEALQSKRFALVGFDAFGADQLIAALETAGATARMVQIDETLPGLNPLAPYDACIVNAPDSAQSSLATQLVDRSLRPALILCGGGDFAKRVAADDRPNRDHLLRSAPTAEMVARLFRIVRSAEKKTAETAASAVAR